MHSEDTPVIVGTSTPDELWLAGPEKILCNDMNLSLILLGGLFAVVVAAPPQRVQMEQPASHHQEPNTNNQNQHATPQDDGQKPMYEFAYSKYLEEVVKILESEPKFSEKLRGMPEADIKSGKIADHIDDLESHVFDKLTKAKLDELERLREQIQKQIEADGGAHNVKIPDHLDATNWERFGKEDLRKLIRRTVEDMEQIDLERQKKFKEYEMRKKAEEDHKLAQMNEEERRKAIHDAEEAKKRHDEHEKLKHPGSRDQLEEVWEEADHMDKDNFDPRTFFNLHDLNGDGFWNADELEALFQKELDKVYNETDPDDDPRERMEEMYRMREHVTKQMDKNGDRLISLDEFLQDTEAQTPNKDPGWKDIGDQQAYTDEELQKFEKEYAKQQGELNMGFFALTFGFLFFPLKTFHFAFSN
ncbi:NUCB1 [Trichostrongylus colubriformis]|uniref:NUCB1 n=1 Tax=Trichostrongylus colubriformis TaxID=6319 RepID=A0AAN8G123_TRICO